MIVPHGDEHFMRLAVTEATAALEHDDVPVGAVSSVLWALLAR